MSTFNSFSFSGKRAIVRVDFNVPMDKTTGLVADDKRIRAALPTIQHILKNGGSVVLLSHFGRPKNGPESVFSMARICDKVSEVLGVKVQFATDCISEEAFEKSKALQPGEVLLLENVRFYAEETKGDLSFAEKLAKHGDCYVNDAFGAAHRAHASTTQLASFFPNAK
ncbi:MAG: phosphoglycerate kinase, partial [Flavobacteriia bacterium]|nr:phosphoglycerate kinase [Flavobacteriia bacterium]